ISWRKFDNGADIIAAIASGDVQIGYLGSSPLTAAITRKVPVETFLIATQIGAAEALVARDGSGIKTPQDLIGKKIAVPFVSTGHYSLLADLKHWNIDPAKVTILNLAPPAIAAAWKRGDIDATYVWDPALGVAKETGKVLITSGELAKIGAPTFDAWIVRKDFADKHPDVVKAFAKVTLDAYADYRKDPQAWLADKDNVAKLVKLSGAKASDIPVLLEGNVYPLAADQANALGAPTTKALTDTATFLKQQGKVDAVLPDYSPYVSAKFLPN
ncbi:MAG: taurine ABC transporter substrate-binding protein, partial [Pseudomonas capeferrum]